MQKLAIFLLIFLLAMNAEPAGRAARQQYASGQSVSSARQLLAVRGEVVNKRSSGPAMLLITVRPAREFAEVTVLARENDAVGAAVRREENADLLGLLSGEARGDETITAAELGEGDMVSIIYDAKFQNRALEIYLR